MHRYCWRLISFLRTEAIQNGFGEALLLNYNNHVVEGTTENIFIVRKNQIITPPTSSGALEGITRKSVIEMVNEKGGDVKESNLSKTQVYDADEIFITGTASEIIAVVQVDDVCIGSGKPGPITVSLQKQYMDATRGNDSKFSSWLYHV